MYLIKKQNKIIVFNKYIRFNLNLIKNKNLKSKLVNFYLTACQVLRNYGLAKKRGY